MIHWIRPAWFLAIIPIAALLILLWKQGFINKKNAWHDICDPHLLKSICPDTPNSSKRHIALIGLSLIWLLAILALAAPSIKKINHSAYKSQHAQIILFDMSDTMQASDLPPTRLTVARYKLMEYLNALKSGQAGLIAFTNWPYVVSPLTEDTNTIAIMVPQLTSDVLPSNGFNLSSALKKAEQLFKQNHTTEGDIIIITGSSPGKTAEKTIKKLSEKGFNTYIWGFGTEHGGPIANSQGTFTNNQEGKLQWSKIDNNTLKHLSTVGNGKYIRFSNDNQDIRSLLTLTQSNNIHTTKRKKSSLISWQDHGRILCWLIALIILPFFRRGVWSNTNE